ncbi:MAG: hypothetical protein FWG02_05245 [Holophagaceae bacterium]|nr:hypothetical protein [Holophagaceae bacterium]
MDACVPSTKGRYGHDSTQCAALTLQKLHFVSYMNGSQISSDSSDSLMYQEFHASEYPPPTLQPPFNSSACLINQHLAFKELSRMIITIIRDMPLALTAVTENSQSRMQDCSPVPRQSGLGLVYDAAVFVGLDLVVFHVHQ